MARAQGFGARSAVDVRAARVVLRREPASALGFVVHGTFPIYL